MAGNPRVTCSLAGQASLVAGGGDASGCEARNSTQSHAPPLAGGAEPRGRPGTLILETGWVSPTVAGVPTARLGIMLHWHAAANAPQS